MADLLYLVHRLPFPPNKGDKVRSFHLLKHLAASHRVHLGTFVDDGEDLHHVDAVRPYCASLHVERLAPVAARLRSLAGLARGSALTVPYYGSAGLRQWVDRTMGEHRPVAAVAFSSSMAQYLPQRPDLATLVDLVDVDSAKWAQYASGHRWPMSWIYAREGRKLLDFERQVVTRSTRAFLVTDAEVELFARLAPECRDRVEVLGNGVDADYFSPAHALASPYEPGETPVVFTGAMDYWPNADAATWFATEILGPIARTVPGVRFYVVGMRPTPQVRALADSRTVVTGAVADVRPYLAHARLVVAPLRLARGVQNKVLEAMAMGKAVLASAACAGGIEATPGVDFATASTAGEFVERATMLLGDPGAATAMGHAARECVVRRYTWTSRLSRIDRHLVPGGPRQAPVGGGVDGGAVAVAAGRAAA